MPQELINWAFLALSSFGGWWLRTVWENHKELANKIAAIEVLVAGNYVKRDEVTGFMIRIEHKIDSLNNRLDSKVDKP
jgi:hypothetical protein